jgi:hypothetical protein
VELLTTSVSRQGVDRLCSQRVGLVWDEFFSSQKEFNISILIMLRYSSHLGDRMTLFSDATSLQILKHAGLSQELLYHWRFTANQFVLTPSPFKPTTSIGFFRLNTCGYSPYVTSSLTRGWICRFQLMLALASAVIVGSESRETHDCLRFDTHPTWRARSPYLYPPGTGWPGYTPRYWVPFSSSPSPHRATVEVF